MQIDWWTIALQGINVLILMWLLGRFFFRPVVRIVEDRRNAASALLQEAERAKAAALKERVEAEEGAAKLRSSRDEILKAAAAAAEAEKASIMTGAQSEADRLLRASLSKLFREESDVKELIKQKAVSELLESVTDKCEDVANIIEGIVLENA